MVCAGHSPRLMANDAEEKQPSVPPQADKPDGPSAPPSHRRSTSRKSRLEPERLPPKSRLPQPRGRNSPRPFQLRRPRNRAPPRYPALLRARWRVRPNRPPRQAACSTTTKEGPVALDNDLVKRYKEKFGTAILEAWMDRKQAILVVARELLAEIALYSRDDEKFDWLAT